MLKKSLFTFIVLSCTFSLSSSISYADLEDFYFQPQRRTLIFVEDYYFLYRKGLYHSTDAHLANIYYLKTALIKAENNRWWAHPSKVFSYMGYNWTSSRRTYTEAQHAKYKELMKMRIALLLTKSYLALGARYDKENIYWFNADDIENPSVDKKEHYLIRGFRIANTCYLEAGKYFFKVKEQVRKLLEDKYVNDRKYKNGILYSNINIQGPELSSMEDDVYKIYFGGSMLEEDAPSVREGREINLKISKEKYLEKVKLYKEEKKYYNKESYPEYNYSKVIREKIAALSNKQKKLELLISKLLKGKEN